MIGDKKNNPDKVSNTYDNHQAKSSTSDINKEKDFSSGLSGQNCVCDKDRKDCDCDKKYEVEPLPESTRPRKDGPGGN